MSGVGERGTVKLAVKVSLQTAGCLSRDPFASQSILLLSSCLDSVRIL